MLQLKYKVERVGTMKIYTSRYSNKELRTGRYTPVGITVGAPRFSLGYELKGNIRELAPFGSLFNVEDRREFTEKYFEKMDKVGVSRVKAIFKQYERYGKDIVLLCYEDVREPNEWCHRLVFAEWWKARTGEEITELEDPTPCKVKKPKAETEKFDQMALF